MRARVSAPLAVLALLAALAPAGCKPEPRSIAVHEPGVYKGAQDPLLRSERQQELINRLNLVQRDR